MEIYVEPLWDTIMFLGAVWLSCTFMIMLIEKFAEEKDDDDHYGF